MEQESGGHGRRVDEEVLCIGFAVCAPGGSSVGLVLPMMLVLLHPRAWGGFDTTHTLPPAAGVLAVSWAAARSAGTSCGLRHSSTAQHSAAQRSATPGWAVGDGAAPIGQGEPWMEKARRRGMRLSCRRDWPAAGGNPGRDQGRVWGQSQSRDGVESGVEAGSQVVCAQGVLSDGVEGAELGGGDGLLLQGLFVLSGPFPSGWVVQRGLGWASVAQGRTRAGRRQREAL